MSITGGTAIYAKAFHPDYTTSAQSGGTYTAKVAAPAFSPDAGTYPYSQLITITDATPGAVIHYTTNGVDPIATDPTIASGGTLHNGNYTLKARAFLTGATASLVTTGTYALTAPPQWSVAAGFNHSVVLSADGTVWTWGANTDGVLGDESTGRSTPGLVANLTDVVAVRSGAFHILALRADGTVWTWGANGSGQLADDSVLSRSTPAAVSGLASITAVAAGSFFSVALKSDGTVWTWGDNEMGQLGDGTREPHATPAQVPGLRDVVAIAAGDAHTSVRRSDGTVWAWGNNEHGQVGDGTTELRVAPTLVAGATASTGPWAGYAHTFVAAADGTVWTWGANWAGQLGLGQSGDVRLVPTVVPSLTNVDVMAAAGHSIAVRADGTVWTWGNNTLGSIGDQSRVNRSTPYQVPGLASISSVAAGLNHSLAVTSDGTLWTWGANINGQLGDGTIEAQLTGESVSESELLWRTSTPTLWPPTGTYSATTTVSVSTVTPGAVIHYTTTGADPTQADPAVAPGGTVTVAQSLTLKAAAWAPGGTFEGTVTVSLSSPIAGTTIRYTIDGSSPTASSPVYTAPITLTTRMTLQARAFRAGWGESGAAVETYLFVDHVPPGITVSAVPPPNAAGWNDTPVTVSFVCTDENSGVAHCPAPILFETEGAGQTMTVTATDVAGNEATRTVTVNLDTTPAAVTLNAPASGATVTTSAITVNATVVDALSGVQGATCNGLAATTAAASASCAVQLRPGRNIVTVHVVDRAGNGSSASASVRFDVTPSRLLVSPSQRALTVGETVSLKAFDDLGDVPAILTWSTDNVEVATVDPSGVVTAHGAGETRITATADMMTAAATITVFPGSLPVGTVRWQSDPMPGYSSAGMVGVHSDDAVFASGETNWTNWPSLQTVVRGLTIDGEQRWMINAPLAQNESVQRVMGDPSGGVLLLATTSGNGSPWGTALIRMSPADDSPSWRHQIDHGAFELAQAPDGTIFYITGNGGNVGGHDLNEPYSVIGVDGATGAMKFRIDAPIQTTLHSFICQQAESLRTSSARFFNLRVDSDGFANVMFTAYQQENNWLPCGGGPAVHQVATQVRLMRISSSGASTEIVLHDYAAGDVFDPGATSPLGIRVQATALVPDAQGGVLAAWAVCPMVNSEQGTPISLCTKIRGRYLQGGSLGGELDLPGLPIISASGQMAYGYRLDTSGIRKFNMTTGQLAWATSTPAYSAVALDGDRVAVSVLGGTTIYAPDGSTAATGQPSFHDSASYTESPLEFGGDTWFGHWPVAVVAASAFADPDAGFGFSSVGNPWGTAAATKAGFGIFAKGHEVGLETINHVSIRILPTAQDRWRTRQLGDPGCYDGNTGYDGSCFTNPDNGKFFATIGAGSTNDVCTGYLLSGINRPRDISVPPIDPPERLRYALVIENALIQRLFELESDYRHSRGPGPFGGLVPYACFPDLVPGAYNSNSFAAGLMLAAGIFPLPSFPVANTAGHFYPGWSKPVPASVFAPPRP